MPTVKIEPLVPSGSAAPAPAVGAAVGSMRGAESAHLTRHTPSQGATPPKDPVLAALRQQLPRQGSATSLLANIAWANRTPEGQAAALPASTRAAVEALWRALTPMEELATPDRLLQAALASGQGLERLLASAGPQAMAAVLLQDWKLLLLRLRSSLPVPARASGAAVATEAPLPGRPGALTALPVEAASLAGAADATAIESELWSQASAAIARVTCHQLANVRGDAPPPAIVFEVPLRQGDDATVLRLRAEQEQASPYLAQARWTIEFAVPLRDRGTLHGRVRLVANRVDVAVEAEDTELLAALREAEPDLRRGLEALGLAVDKLGWRCASKVDTGETGSWLVDMRA